MTGTAICYIEGDIFYWYDFDKFDIDGIAIPLETRSARYYFPLKKLCFIHISFKVFYPFR